MPPRSSKLSSKAHAASDIADSLGGLTIGPKIIATSQTSRFHVDTITTLSQEIDLKQVNISVGNLDLLVDAHVRLKTGIRYALVGRNGEGKSTLLKAIADKLIPGIHENLRILLVSQVESESEDVNLAGEEAGVERSPELTVTERVVKSDRRREKATSEYQLLTKAFESTSPTALVEAVALINLSRSQYELEEAKKIALRRSGARGAEARKQLLKAEAAFAENERRVSEADWGSDDGQALKEATELLTEVQATLEALEADSTEARARSILIGLGFTQAQLDAKYNTLSGGWRSRCSLANALLQQPDLLMLDEPTNYLDLISVIWLQNYLESLSSTILVVAHDLDFINAITQETIHLRDKKLSYFDGNLSEYERYTRADRKSRIRQKSALDKKRSAIEKSIETGIKTAKKTGDENRARMVKSRQKKLDERWGLERSAKGTRFKLNRDAAGYHFTSRADIKIEDPDKAITLPFPDPEPMRFPGALISASNITFTYSRTAPNVLEDVSLTIHPGARVGLVGKNGEGKSTLVKLLIGSLRPQKGTVERHPRLRLGYFDQHSVEILSTADIARTSALGHFIEQLKEKHGIEIDEQTGRSFLGAFGLHGKTAINPISTLSGGQKVRLAMGLVVYPAPDLLVLDEATTHLDKDTITALIRALRQYTGAVLLVSHDRHFTRCVVEGAPIIPPSDDPDDDDEEEDDSDEEGQTGQTGTVYVVGPKGRVKPLSGGTDEYVALVERRMKRLGLLK
ncbi:hypothetical protein BOTBODRAFT_246354 [Botryobasidium botryosum FD-172 SS1]|uniref:ABC transporter domain-containing protein n=1 Tax=Botryobasidium botryosum (strain FD-172 SS1) TaxID=930990 RepID=A0A067M4S9_BOTB1|nr:hypothetical protein BOTBODRAFT_246354 [Botryobasidium botryosum FD-172 SS1]